MEYSTTKRLIKMDDGLIPFPNENKEDGGLRLKSLSKKSEINKPLISIITVVFNGEKFLEKTILSVLNQTYDNIEYIIIDGGSTDKSLDIIKKYNNALDYWLSEKDNGIYDAMNKGLKFISGDIIGIINSDDWYNSDSIDNVVKLHLRNKNNLSIYFGDLFKYSRNGDYLFKVIRDKKYLTKKINWGMPLNHPSTFVCSEVYHNIGFFDTTYRICGDYDFIYRSYKSKLISFRYSNTITANMRLGGVSDDKGSFYIRVSEHFRIRSLYISKLKNTSIYLYMRILFYIKDNLRIILKRLGILDYYYENKK